MTLWTWMIGCTLLPSGTDCGPGTEEIDGVCVATDDALPPDPPLATDDTGLPASHPSGPTILSVSSNLTELTEGDRLVITAIVTDPDGIDDLIGGELKGSGGATYGAFVTSAQEGAYAVELTWDDFAAVEDLTFERDLQLSLTIWFFDVAGHATTAPFDLSLFCDAGAACDGRCTHLNRDPGNCGACDHRCEDDELDDVCQQGQCVQTSDCATQWTTTCDEVCAASGLGACVEATWYGQRTVGHPHQGPQCGGPNGQLLTSCSASLGSQAEATGYTCYCLES